MIVDYRRNILVVVVAAIVQPSRAINTPCHNLQSCVFDRERMLGRHDAALLIVDFCQSQEGPCHNLEASDGKVWDGGGGGDIAFEGVDALVKVDSLHAKLWFILDPVENVALEDRLRPHAARIDAGVLICLDHIFRRLLLGISIKQNVDLGRLQLWRKLQIPAINQADVLILGEDNTAGRV